MYYQNTLKITFQNTKSNIKTVLKSVDIHKQSFSAFIVVINQSFPVSSLFEGLILVLSLI